MTLEKCIKINDSLSNTMTKPDCSQTTPDHPIKAATVDALPPKHVPSTTNDADPDFICPVCSSPSISSCRNCKKISYCGKAHQRLHWRVHRAECFPLIHQYDPHILGSRLIATRNIKPGEIIWTEKALLSGPALPTAISRSSSYRRGEGEEEKADSAACSTNPAEELVCLGCFQVVNTDYRCPCCSLPLCGPNCVGDHVELECKIFTSLRHEQQLVDGSSHLAEGPTRRPRWDGKCYHGVITIIRGVLLKEVDPPRWKKLLELDEMWNGKECDNSKKTSSATNFGQFCHEFIMSLGLLNVTNEDVALVLRVISYRRCEVYDPPSRDLWERHCWTSKPHAFHLFYTACQATPSCVPNSSWIIQRDSTTSTPTTQIHLRALLPIQFGRTVTLSYANAEKGIKDRQALLPRHGESTVSCECERCKDPEELATFFSAIKCPGDHHENSSKSLTTTVPISEAPGTDMCASPTTLTTNWLLPTTVQVPLKQDENHASRFKKELMWQCHDCGLTKDSNYYNQVVSHVEKDFCDICFVSQTKEEKVGRAWRTSLIENLESLSQKYSDCFSVHPNHCAIYEVEMFTLELMSSQLADLNGTLTDAKWTLLVERFTSLCRKWLEVADVLWPGLSRQRGQLLYYYQQALVIQLILSISRRMRGGGEDDDETIGEQELGSSEKLEDFSKIQQSLLEKEFLKILNIRKVVVNIFCYDDNATIGRKYANSLVLKCPEIEILKHYVFQTNKA